MCGKGKDSDDFSFYQRINCSLLTIASVLHFCHNIFHVFDLQAEKLLLQDQAVATVMSVFLSKVRNTL